MNMQRNFGPHHEEIVELSKLMLAVWQEVDPDSSVARNPAGYVETFTDIAKVITAVGYHRDTGAAALRAAAADFEEAAALGIEPVLNRTAATLLRGRAKRMEADQLPVEAYGYMKAMGDAGVSSRTLTRGLRVDTLPFRPRELD